MTQLRKTLPSKATMSDSDASQQLTILFDIDVTLFDVYSFFQERVAPTQIKLFGISKEEYFRRVDAYYELLKDSTQFDPIQSIQYLSGQDDVQSIADQTIFNDAFIRESRHSDVLETLQKTSQIGQLGIFSQGQTAFQTKKVTGMDIMHYFEPELVFISRKKTDPEFLAQLPVGSVIIDDRQSFVQDLLDYTPGKFDVVWINRKAEEPTTSAHQIASLLELIPYLQNKYLKENHA